MGAGVQQIPRPVAEEDAHVGKHLVVVFVLAQFGRAVIAGIKQLVARDDAVDGVFGSWQVASGGKVDDTAAFRIRGAAVVKEVALVGKHQQVPGLEGVVIPVKLHARIAVLIAEGRAAAGGDRIVRPREEIIRDLSGQAVRHQRKAVGGAALIEHLGAAQHRGSIARVKDAELPVVQGGGVVKGLLLRLWLRKRRRGGQKRTGGQQSRCQQDAADSNESIFHTQYLNGSEG